MPLKFLLIQYLIILFNHKTLNMGFLQYKAICLFLMSVLLVLNVNILTVRVIYQSLWDRIRLQRHP